MEFLGDASLSVLGYLLAGIVIGPGLGYVGAETKESSTSRTSASS